MEDQERIEHILRLITKAIEDIRQDRPGNAIGKLNAAKGNLHILHTPNN